MRNFVVAIEKEFAHLCVVAIGRDGAIFDILRTVNLEILVLVPPFEETTEDQNYDTVTNDENAHFAIVARQRSKETLHMESDIGAALTSWRAIPIFAFSLTTLGLLRKPLSDAFGVESVKDPKFDFTDAFFYDKPGRIKKCGW
jgi:hypothetical protein